MGAYVVSELLIMYNDNPIDAWHISYFQRVGDTSYLIFDVTSFITIVPHVSKESMPGSSYPKSMITARLSWLVAMIRR